MIFAHDTEVALASAAALVNTGRGGKELLPDLAALDRFVAGQGWTGVYGPRAWRVGMRKKFWMQWRRRRSRRTGRPWLLQRDNQTPRTP